MCVYINLIFFCDALKINIFFYLIQCLKECFNVPQLNKTSCAVDLFSFSLSFLNINEYKKGEKIIQIRVLKSIFHKMKRHRKNIRQTGNHFSNKHEVRACWTYGVKKHLIRNKVRRNLCDIKKKNSFHLHVILRAHFCGFNEVEKSLKNYRLSSIISSFFFSFFLCYNVLSGFCHVSRVNELIYRQIFNFLIFLMTLCCH